MTELKNHINIDDLFRDCGLEKTESLVNQFVWCECPGLLDVYLKKHYRDGWVIIPNSYLPYFLDSKTMTTVNYSNDKFGNEITVLNIENGIKRDKKMKNLSQEVVSQIIAEWHSAMEDAERHYMRMIELGSSPQIARSVLPHSTKATLVVTMNYRSWRHFFELRTPGDAHPQIRDIAIPLLAEFKKKIPIIFDDIEVKE